MGRDQEMQHQQKGRRENSRQRGEEIGGGSAYGREESGESGDNGREQGRGRDKVGEKERN